jgi:DUF1365 family protein
MSFRSALYRGELLHARHDGHARRTFRYSVYVAALDLDELPALDRGLRLFSYRRRNVFALDDRDYETGDLRGGLNDLLAANRVPSPHTTRLVTNLKVAGYVFNPVSFLLNYDVHRELTSVIAEVNNTYGGRRRYVLGPEQRIATGTFRHVRELFVSPFLHGELSYDFVFDAPLDGAHLSIEMLVHDQTAAPADQAAPPFGDAGGGAGRRVFTARLSGARAPLSDRALLTAAARYPLMTAQVIGLIHWQALKLRLRGVPYRRPGPDHRPLPAR